jgi:methyl-accepting chemotaxis protein
MKQKIIQWFSSSLEIKTVLLSSSIMILLSGGFVLYVAKLLVPILSKDLRSKVILQIVFAEMLVGLVFVAVGWLIVRRIAKSLVGIGRAGLLLAAGDLSQSITLERQDEIGQLAQANRLIAEYMSGIAALAGHILEGDLSVQIDPKSENDMLGDVFSRMTIQVHNLVQNINDNAAGIGASSNEFSAAAVQNEQAIAKILTTFRQVATGITQQADNISVTSSTIEMMARTVDDVARGAQEQSLAIGRATEMTDQIIKSIHLVAENSQVGAQAAIEAVQSARQSSSAVEANILRMQTIKEKVDIAERNVAQMGERSQQIGEIVETIQDFAEQTNLLALNAAIEAARAGEQGRGFAVVAIEVRKLAEKSAAATNQINNLITDVRRTVDQAVDAMRLSSQEVDVGVELSHQAGQALGEILATIEDIMNQVKEIASASQGMDISSSELMSAMESVSAVVEENAAATKEMSANSERVLQTVDGISNISQGSSAAVNEVLSTTEQLRTQIAEVAAAALGLDELAKNLNSSVAGFNLGEKKTIDGYLKTKITEDEQGLTGTGFLYRRDFVREYYGESEWQRILADLSPETRSLLSGTILPTHLYPQSAYAEFLGTLKRRLGGSDPNAFARKAARYVAKAEARGAYSSALKADGPLDLAQRFPMLFKMQFSHGELKSTQKGPSHFIYEMTHPVEEELCQNSWVGFMQGLMELQGEEQCSVEHISCVHKGDACCAYELKW